jgi:catechol 2,3-dioxygenase-like lactoylglutathione lyase family enzyme
MEKGSTAMTLQTNGPSHFAIRVTDLARPKKFYVETLGFQQLLETEGLVLVNADGAMLGIRGMADPTGSGDRFDPHRVGLDHLALAVPDAAALDGLLQQLNAAGVPNNDIERDDLTGGTYISFYDPDGIAWELYAMPRR